MTGVRTRAKPVDDATVAPEPTTKKKSELDAVLGQISKTHGPLVMRKASDIPPFKHLPTGIFVLDMALLGGFPEGLCTMLYGWESSGKTTLAMRAVAAAQAKHPDKRPVFLDIEGTYDPTWGDRHGVDNDRMVLSQPESGEQALDVADAVLRAEDVSLVVIDSLPALVPMKEIEGSMEDQQVGLQARLIGKFLRKMQQALIDERKRGHFPTIILINQWRTKIGVMHGNPNTLPGGNALRYVHSVGVEVLSKPNADGKDANGNAVFDFNDHGFRIKKSKGIGNSLPAGEFRMIRNPDHPLGAGWIDDADTVVTFGRRFGLITGDGSSPKRIDGVDQTFGKFTELVDFFYSDLDFFEVFKARLITMQRAKMGVIPDNWY